MADHLCMDTKDTSTGTFQTKLYTYPFNMIKSKACPTLSIIISAILQVVVRTYEDFSTCTRQLDSSELRLVVFLEGFGL